MNHRIINGDCLKILLSLPGVDCIFADPPDNLGLDYGECNDSLEDYEYIWWLKKCLLAFIDKSPLVWLSYNAKWSFAVGGIIQDLLYRHEHLKAKPCVQTFTFGQHNQHDLGNCHRPLLRLRWKDAPLYPNQIRVPSWRQLNGDKRADRRGRVPGDVFDFPRVTGNSKQRRSWCPTQLHESLIERCIKLSTTEYGTVLDPFAGTGTTLRVCKRINRHCTLIEQGEEYCRLIGREHNLEYEKSGEYIAKSNHHCQVCGRKMISTSNKWLVCENGCGRLQPTFSCASQEESLPLFCQE